MQCSDGLPQYGRPARPLVGAAATQSPADDVRGIAASIHDGLLLGAGDAVIGINPATDSPEIAHGLLSMLDDIRLKLNIPTQSPACSRMSRPRSI